ncbi:MAG: type IV pilin protein [Myxococcota bacterium]
MDPTPQRRSAIPGWFGAVVVILVAVFLCAGAVPVMGIVAAIAIPNFVSMQLKAKRAEVPATVDAIKVAELAHHAAFDTWVAAGSERDARSRVGKQKQLPPRDPGWEKLGWAPADPQYGAYWVVVTGDGFEVHGVSDVDGDGVLAEYVATQDRNATLVSEGWAY